MGILGDALSQAQKAKETDVNSYVWKGPREEINGQKVQKEIKLVNMTKEELQACLDHCVSMLYNADKDNPGRYVLLRIIRNQRMKCNAELFMRYLDKQRYPRFKYQEDLRDFLRKHEQEIAEDNGLSEDNQLIIDQIKQLPISIIKGIPDEFKTLPINVVIDACLDTLGNFSKKHLTLNFITKLSLWFTPQEMKDLTERDENGKIRNRLEVIKERLGIRNNTRLLIDNENPQLNYTEFRAAVQLKNKPYSMLTTDQLTLLRDKLLFRLEDEVEEHIKQWKLHIDQIDQVRKLKGWTLTVNV